MVNRGLLYSLALAVTILGFGGAGFWLLDPSVDSFSDGLWLAFTTAATVGYGDLVPSTHASRLFSVLVVLLGLAVLSLVTASLAAIFVEQEVDAEERDIERDLMREIRALRAEVQALRAEVSHAGREALIAVTPPHPLERSPPCVPQVPQPLQGAGGDGNGQAQ
jgi:voltage-gated potassium channel